MNRNCNHSFRTGPGLTICEAGDPLGTIEDCAGDGPLWSWWEAGTFSALICNSRSAVHQERND